MDEVAVLSLLALATLAAGCASSSGGGSDGSVCVPPPESCDLASPAMMLLEPSGCLGPPTKLPQLCDTSVNRCYPSAGLGLVCAFEPGGNVYVTFGSDNDVLTAAGWRFSEYVEPSSIPSDQTASSNENALCQMLQCASPCPGVTGTPFPFVGGSCAADAGPRGAAE